MPRNTYIIEIGPSQKPAKMPASTERYIERMPGETTERRVHWTSGYDDEANYNPSPGPAPATTAAQPRSYQPAPPQYAPVQGTTYRDYGTASYGASFPPGPGPFRSGTTTFSQVSPPPQDDSYYFSSSQSHRRARRPRSSTLTNPFSSYFQPRSNYFNTPRTSTLRLSDDDLLADDDVQAATAGCSGERRRSSRRSREFEETIAELRRQLDIKDLEIDRTKTESREQKRHIQKLEKTTRELEVKLKQADDSAERYLDRYRELLVKTST